MRTNHLTSRAHPCLHLCLSVCIFVILLFLSCTKLEESLSPDDCVYPSTMLHIITPQNGSRYWHTDAIELSWSTSQNATQYQLSITTIDTTIDIFVDSPSYQLLVDAIGGLRGLLYFKVRALDSVWVYSDSIWSKWSPTCSVKVYPYEVGHCALPDGAHEIKLFGAYAYTADGGGLSIIDISVSSSPFVIGNYSFDDYASGVAISGFLAYIALWADYYGEEDIGIVNISNPSNPYKVGEYRFDYFRTGGVRVSGQYAYVNCADWGGLRILDISNPSNPFEVGSYSGYGWTANDLEIFSSYVYISIYDANEMQIVDVSDPSNPHPVGIYYNPNFYVGDIEICYPYAYISCGGLRTIDISDPTNPQEVNFCDLGVNHIAASNSHLCTSGDTLFVMDITNPSDPREIGYLPKCAGGEIAISDSLAYVSTYSALSIINFHRP